MKKINYKHSLNRVTRIRYEIVLLIIFMISSQTFAQYSIKKYTINSGGSTMNGGNYQVSASIGQVDASNTLNGGSYNLTGGFWQPSSNTNNEIIFVNSFE